VNTEKDHFAYLHNPSGPSPTLRLAGGDGQAEVADEMPPMDDDGIQFLAETEPSYPDEPPEEATPPDDTGYDGPIKPRFLSVRDLVAKHPNLRPPVVHSILREGEIINLIAPPKRGKSWLAMDLALSVASGRMWLNTYQTVRGDVLMLDNELHAETSAFRIPKVATARGMMKDEYADHLCIDNLRGRLQDIEAMASYFRDIPKGRFKLIILDAMYRFLPKGVEENDNAGITQIYNSIDRYAYRIGCSFVLIHHASKGNQSAKSITDVGSGAGSMSRASDSHMILRDHEEPNAVVLEGVVRSFEPLKPLVMRWEFPIWKPDATLDPTKLKDGRNRSESEAEKAITVEQFVVGYVSDQPKLKEAIIGPAVRAKDITHLSERKAAQHFKQALGDGLIHPWKFGGANTAKMYATLPQPKDEPQIENPPATKKPRRSSRKAANPE
jgi:hypothetical protein